MTIARRDFLKVVSGASIASSLTTYSTASLGTATDSLAFGFTDENVPMNAANLCPMPSNVTAAHARYAQALDLSLSADNRTTIVGFKEEARSQVAAMLGSSSDEIAIVRNTSEANNVIVQGIPLQAGDEVVLWDQNHPSNGVAWDVQAKRVGATVRRFSVPRDTSSIDEVIDHFIAAVSDKTTAVSFTHISNITGFRTPAAEICAALRKRKADVFIHIDGAQTWGAVDIDLGAIEADSFSGSAHKWFMGPREVGILYVRKQHIDNIWPNIVSIPWGQMVDDAPAGARKFDALGQRDDAAVAALGDAAALHEALTPAGIEARSMMLADRLRESLKDLGVTFVSTSNPLFTSSVVIISVPRESARELTGKVYDNSGIITAPTGGLRMSPHVYNTEDHIDRVVAAVKKFKNLLS
jgi:selenocysteine lyase/cysteine desulfurase